MKYIKLNKNKFATVDDEDFVWLTKFKWHYKDGYAESQINKKHFYMHTVVNKTLFGKETDHINRNKLDNRKINLREADKRMNAINRDLQKNNTSGHKGISWCKKISKWETYIWNNRKKVLLGFFTDINEAILIRKKAEKIYHVI